MPMELRVDFANVASYISIAISDWIVKFQLDLGKVNRISFIETSRSEVDFKYFESAKFLQINISHEFEDLAQFSNAEITHEYFKLKFIEGFKRFDAHFGFRLAPELEAFLDDYFKNGCVYEKEMKSKRINGLKHQVLKQYKYDVFNLVLRVFDKTGAVIKEMVLQSGKPDPFLVHYNVNKVNILDDKIEVLGSTGKVETEHSLVMH